MIWANVTKFGQNFIAPQIFLGWYGHAFDVIESCVFFDFATDFLQWVFLRYHYVIDNHNVSCCMSFAL